MKLYKVLNSKTTDKSLCLEVEIDPNYWQATQKKLVGEMAKSIKIKGFRPGKIPPNLASQSINKAELMQKSAQNVMNSIYESVQQEEIVASNDNVIDDYPTIDFKTITEQNCVLLFYFDLIPNFQLPDYKKIKDLTPLTKLTEAEFNNEIEKLAKTKSTMVDVSDKKLANGDIAIIDFTGIVDNKKLASASAQNYELAIGSNSFIKGFETGLIAMKVNQKKTLALTFPSDYHVKELQSKPVTFEVVLKAIKKLEFTPMDETNFKSFLPEQFQSFTSLKAFKSYFHKLMENKKQETILQENNQKIRQFLLTNTKLPFLPEALIKLEANRLLKLQQSQAEQYKIPFEKLLSASNITLTELQDRNIKEAKENVTFALVMKKIADIEKIKVDNNKIKAEIENVIAVEYPFASDEMKKQLFFNMEQQKEFVESIIINRLTTTKIVSYSTH